MSAVTKTVSNKGKLCIFVGAIPMLYTESGTKYWRCSVRTQIFLLPYGLSLRQTYNRTNNGAESFHSHFMAQFTAPHPTFYIFWDVIIKQQSVTYVKIKDVGPTRYGTDQERGTQTTAMSVTCLG